MNLPENNTGRGKKWKAVKYSLQKVKIDRRVIREGGKKKKRKRGGEERKEGDEGKGRRRAEETGRKEKYGREETNWGREKERLMKVIVEGS